MSSPYGWYIPDPHSIETMDAYFENVASILHAASREKECRHLISVRLFDLQTELDLLCNLEKVHWIMDDIVAKGLVGETNRERILEIRR